MKDLFTELYKKVLGFFQNQEKDNIGGSNIIATNRLKLVLMQDRTNLTPYLLEKMRAEMIDVLSKYVEMDKEALELNFEQEGDQMALMLSIPVVRAKDEEEINAAIKAEEEAKAAAEDAEEEAKEEESKGEEETSEALEETTEESCDEEKESQPVDSAEETETEETTEVEEKSNELTDEKQDDEDKKEIPQKKN